MQPEDMIPVGVDDYLAQAPDLSVSDSTSADV